MTNYSMTAVTRDSVPLPARNYKRKPYSGATGLVDSNDEKCNFIRTFDDPPTCDEDLKYSMTHRQRPVLFSQHHLQPGAGRKAYRRVPA